MFPINSWKNACEESHDETHEAWHACSEKPGEASPFVKCRRNPKKLGTDAMRNPKKLGMDGLRNPKNLAWEIRRSLAKKSPKKPDTDAVRNPNTLDMYEKRNPKKLGMCLPIYLNVECQTKPKWA